MSTTGVKFEARLGELFAQLPQEVEVNLRAVGSLLVELTRDHFKTETSPEGEAWRKSRRAKDESGKTLQDSRNLFHSLLHQSEQMQLEMGVPREYMGSPLEYAAIHQFGGTIKPKTKKALAFGGGLFGKAEIPARPYLGWGKQEIKVLEDELLQGWK